MTQLSGKYATGESTNIYKYVYISYNINLSIFTHVNIDNKSPWSLEKSKMVKWYGALLYGHGGPLFKSHFIYSLC